MRLAFDSLSMRDSRLFGWGWLLHETQPVQRIELMIRAADDSVQIIPCLQTGSREDLADAFPDIPHARSGGFMLQARIQVTLDNCQACIRCVLADGSEHLLPLAEFPGAYLTSDRKVVLHNRLRLLCDLFKARRWQVLLRRLFFALFRQGAGLVARLGAVITRRARGGPVLIIDHDMGGGANHFRCEQVRALRAQGHRVLLLVPHLASLSYVLIEPIARGERRRSQPDLESALAVLPGCAKIIVNSLVSFDDPSLVLRWLLSCPSGTHITFYLHDFHPVCPVWTLVDERGRYCGIPGPDRCRACLAANPAPFLGFMPSPDVGQWRKLWGDFLKRADRVVAFSRASVDVLRRAFPDLSTTRDVEIKPHDTSYIKPNPVAFDLSLPLTIGVVGHINLHKGAQIVAQMVRIIETESLPARIVVIGSIDNVPASAALRVCGAYRSEKLPEILRRERVGICLLPSICHETFSYVTAELMAHRMPLVVFDLGAPAERVRAYPLGRIIQRVDALCALQAIFELRDDLLRKSSHTHSPMSGVR